MIEIRLPRTTDTAGCAELAALGVDSLDLLELRGRGLRVRSG